MQCHSPSVVLIPKIKRKDYLNDENYFDLFSVRGLGKVFTSSEIKN